MKPVYDVFPSHQNGEVIYSETNLSGFGAFGAVTQANLQAATAAVGAATSALPNKPVTQQSDFGKVANTLGTVAGLVAVIPGIGWVAAAVCGVVAGVCFLLGKLFANSKAKAYAAERAQYDLLNAQIRFENQELDNQYVIGITAINDLRVAFKSMDGLDGGLGLCLINCKKDRQKELLNNAKAEHEVLVEEQENKTKILMSIVDEFNKLMKAKFELNETKEINTWLLWILGGSALVLGGYYTYENRDKIKKELSK